MEPDGEEDDRGHGGSTGDDAGGGTGESPGLPPPSGDAQHPPSESGWGLATSGSDAIPAQPAPTAAPTTGSGHVVQPSSPAPIVQQVPVVPPVLPHGVHPGYVPLPLGSLRPVPGTPFVESELATWWQRFGAYILNNVITIMATISLGGIALGIVYAADSTAFSRGPLGDEPSPVAIAVFIVSYLLLFVGPVIYDWVLLATVGTTPGHRAAGIAVRRLDGTRISGATACGRAWTKFGLYAVVGQCTGMTPIASAITIGVTDRRQGLHDMVCSTVVVQREALARHEEAARARTP